MLRLRSNSDDQPKVPIRIERMGIGRGLGKQGEGDDGIDTQTLESLVIMADEIASFEREAMGLGVSALPDPPRSLVAVAPARPRLGWMPRIAGLAAAVALAAGLWQVTKAPSTPMSSAERLGAGGTGSGVLSAARSGSSFAHARDIMLGERALDWADPNAARRLTFGGVTRLAMLPVRDDALASEERSLILAVFQDDDSPWCECVRVQTGTLCSGQRVDQVSKEDLISAAMDSSCMVGAERVSIFAFTGPASKLPATREEAEALAITLAGLPVECLKSDPCVQHVASACLPAGVAMVSQTLAVNDIKAGW